MKSNILPNLFTPLMENSVVQAQQQALNVLTTTPGTIPASTDVQYACTLVDLWTAARHPINYPFSSAHWSPPLIVAHSEAYTMWESGALASLGVERVAETGNVAVLRSEVLSFSPSSATGTPVVGRNQFGVSQTLSAVDVTAERHFISSATMVAPSPDWFTGLSGFDALSSATNTWYESFSVETFPWDAGTEMGVTYSLVNNPENPHVPISQITASTPPATVTGVLLDPSNTTVLPVARWDCDVQLPPTAAPSVTPTMAPTAGPTRIGAPGAGTLGTITCFPQDALVDVQDKGLVQMRHLNVGDKVLVDRRVSKNGQHVVDEKQYETVYLFGHKLPNVQVSEYLQIWAGDQELVLSRTHMVFVVESSSSKQQQPRPIPAFQVKVGDQMQLVDTTTSVVDSSSFGRRLVNVTDIQTVTAHGLYAPFTLSGSIVVNGIRASTFASLQETEKLHVRGYDTGITHQWLYQTLLSPLSSSSSWMLLLHDRVFRNPQETLYTEDGIPVWLAGLWDFYLWCCSQNLLVQGLVMAGTVSVALVAVLLHAVVYHPLPGMLLLVAGFTLRPPRVVSQ